MTHNYAHPEHLLHGEQIHWEGWIALVGTAFLVAAWVAGVAGAVDLGAFAFLGDPNLVI